MSFGSKFFSSTIKPASHLLRAIGELSIAEQKSLMASIYPTFKEKILESIENKMQTVIQLQTANPPRYTASIEKLGEASHLADVLLKVNHPSSFSKAEKAALADVHAQYASSLYKYRPSQTVLSDKIRLKSYELDPNNKTAQELTIDMNYIAPADGEKLNFK